MIQVRSQHVDRDVQFQYTNTKAQEFMDAGNPGTDHDTSAFAVESIRRWWNIVGKPAYPDA